MRGPYFRNNSAATLEDVLTFYQALFARREVLAPSTSSSSSSSQQCAVQAFFAAGEARFARLPAETLS